MDGVGFVAGLLRDIDAQVAGLDAALVSGQAQDWVKYRELVARRAAALDIRRSVVERLTTEQRQFLGLRPD